MSDGADREIIDEKGRVFGLVNIVDVLVILLVLAVVVGGVAVVLSTDSDTEPAGDDQPPGTNDTNATNGENVTNDGNVTNESRFVTLDFGTVPTYMSEHIDEGQQWPEAATGDHYTITDVYLSGQFGDRTTVVVRARVNGTYNQTSDVFKFRDNPLRLGDSITLTTDDIRVGARVTDIADTGDILSRSNPTVTVVTTEMPQFADAIEVGDEYRVGGQPIAEITGVQREDIEETVRERIYLDIRVLAIERGSTREFAGRVLRLGTSIPFATDRYEFGGEIVAIQDNDGE